MSLIKWNQDLIVNIPDIDEQHERFVGYVNQLYDSRRKKSSPEEVGKLIAELVEYAWIHFKTEERYFDMFRYNESVSHRKEHEIINNKLHEFKKKYDEGSGLLLAMKLSEFLKEWFEGHVVKVDKEFSKLLYINVYNKNTA